jgi:segregation and condensation protein A
MAAVDAHSRIDSALAADSTGVSDAAEAYSAGYAVRLPCFEGPLDLLLHLIRRDQLDVQDIPVARICQSYVEYLKWMQQCDFNVAGEFLVMAATLTLLKSQMLLPREETADEEQDPRLPLVAQLMEYERFKKAAQELDGKSWLGRDVYARPPSAWSETVPVETLLDAPLESIDTYEMLVCFRIALDRTTKKPIEIHTDPTSIKEKVAAVSTVLIARDSFEFTQLVPSVQPTKFEVICAFLAILELAKLKFIEILQAEAFGPIQVRRVRKLEDLDLGLLDQY